MAPVFDALISMGPLLLVHELWQYVLITVGAFYVAFIVLVVIDQMLFVPLTHFVRNRGSDAQTHFERGINPAFVVLNVASGAIYSLSYAFAGFVGLGIIAGWFAVRVAFTMFTADPSLNRRRAVNTTAILLVEDAFEVGFWVGLTALFLHFIVLA